MKLDSVKLNTALWSNVDLLWSTDMVVVVCLQSVKLTNEKMSGKFSCFNHGVSVCAIIITV